MTCIGITCRDGGNFEYGFEGAARLWSRDVLVQDLPLLWDDEVCSQLNLWKHMGEAHFVEVIVSTPFFIGSRWLVISVGSVQVIPF